MNKKQLYESIMRNISYEIKKALNEQVLNNSKEKHSIMILIDYPESMIYNENNLKEKLDLINEAYGSTMNNVLIGTYEEYADILDGYMHIPHYDNISDAINDFIIKNHEVLDDSITPDVAFEGANQLIPSIRPEMLIFVIADDDENDDRED